MQLSQTVLSDSVKLWHSFGEIEHSRSEMTNVDVKKKEKVVFPARWSSQTGSVAMESMVDGNFHKLEE